MCGKKICYDYSLLFLGKSIKCGFKWEGQPTGKEVTSVNFGEWRWGWSWTCVDKKQLWASYPHTQERVGMWGHECISATVRGRGRREVVR